MKKEKTKEYFKVTPEMLEPVSVVLQSRMFHWENLPKGVTDYDMEEMILTKGIVATMNWLQDKFRQESKEVQ